jgi:hypothetical protein
MGIGRQWPAAGFSDRRKSANHFSQCLAVVREALNGHELVGQRDGREIARAE